MGWSPTGNREKRLGDRADRRFFVGADMDGLDLATRIRERDHDVPIIFMTGFPSVDSAVAALRQKADDYFVKPFNLKQMSRAVDAALARSGIVPPQPESRASA